MITLKDGITPKPLDKLYDKGVSFLEAELIFRRQIYTLCDQNIGEEIFFTGFKSLWPDLYCNFDINNKALAYLTDTILNELARQRIIQDISREFFPRRDSPYFSDSSKTFIPICPVYKILPHLELFSPRKDIM